jgi:hypothetical protein
MILADINHFNILASYKDSSEDDNDNPDLIPYNFNVELLSKPYKITASLINKATFLKKHQIKMRTITKMRYKKGDSTEEMSKEKLGVRDSN